MRKKIIAILSLFILVSCGPSNSMIEEPQKTTIDTGAGISGLFNKPDEIYMNLDTALKYADKVKHLSLSFKQLDSFPTSIFNLKSLKSLNYQDVV
ncbi:MAG: hypothetical protein IPG89_17870 [Bacteroidetes bacterium]|nr:hypothetical protein [Bacteroidota bacterium]